MNYGVLDAYNQVSPSTIFNALPCFGEVKYEKITDNGLTITSNDGRRQTLEIDSIIPVMPWTPTTELVKSLESRVPETYLIGDCKEPRLILDAVGEGFHCRGGLLVK